MTDLQQEGLHSVDCFYYPLAAIEPSFDLVHNLYFYPLILKTKEETKNVLTEVKVIKMGDEASRTGLPVFLVVSVPLMIRSFLVK